MKKIFLPLLGLGLVVILVLMSRERFSNQEDSGQIVVTQRQDEAENRTSEREVRVVDERSRTEEELNEPQEQGIRVEDDEVYFPRFDQLTEDELDELEELYDDAEERWSSTMENFILNELGLGPDVMRAYTEVRDSFEDARWDAFEDFHERLFMEEGEDFSYRMTEYHENVEQPLAESYRERLLDLFGEDNYKRFLEIKDGFNDDLRSRQDPRHGIILIHL